MFKKKHKKIGHQISSATLYLQNIKKLLMLSTLIWILVPILELFIFSNFHYSPKSNDVFLGIKNEFYYMAFLISLFILISVAVGHILTLPSIVLRIIAQSKIDTLSFSLKSRKFKKAFLSFGLPIIAFVFMHGSFLILNYIFAIQALESKFETTSWSNESLGYVREKVKSFNEPQYPLLKHSFTKDTKVTLLVPASLLEFSDKLKKTRERLGDPKRVVLPYSSLKAAILTMSKNTLISDPNLYSPLPIESRKIKKVSKKVFYSFNKNQSPDLSFLLKKSDTFPSSYDIIYNRFTLSQLHLYFFIKLGLFKFLNSFLDYTYLNNQNNDLLKDSFIRLKESQAKFNTFIIQLPEGEKTLPAKERTLAFNNPQLKESGKLLEFLNGLDIMLSKIIDNTKNKDYLSILPYQDESSNIIQSYGFYSNNQDYFYLKNKNCYGALMNLDMNKNLFHHDLNLLLTQMNKEYKTFPFVKDLIIPSLKNYYSKSVVCHHKGLNYIINYNKKYSFNTQNFLFKKPIDSTSVNAEMQLSSLWLRNIDIYSFDENNSIVKKNRHEDDVKTLLKSNINEIFQILDKLSQDEFQENP